MFHSITDFSSETMGVRRQWKNLFKMWKEKKIPVNPEFHIQQKYVGIMKTFLDKDKLSKFIVTKSALQEMLNHSLQSKEKVYSKKKKKEK
jgi:hypothetical protein